MCVRGRNVHLWLQGGKHFLRTYYIIPVLEFELTGILRLAKQLGRGKKAKGRGRVWPAGLEPGSGGLTAMGPSERF